MSFLFVLFQLSKAAGTSSKAVLLYIKEEQCSLGCLICIPLNHSKQGVCVFLKASLHKADIFYSDSQNPFPDQSGTVHIPLIYPGSLIYFFLPTNTYSLALFFTLNCFCYFDVHFSTLEKSFRHCLQSCFDFIMMNGFVSLANLTAVLLNF